MFEEFRGIPAHPLIVHAAVVFVPLLILAGFAYALLPAFRRTITWAVLGLVVIAPAAAWAAKLSGEAFQQRLIRRGASGPLVNQINEHASFAATLVWWTMGLAAAVLVLVVLTRTRRRGPALDSPEINADAAAVMGPPASARVLSLVLTVVVIGLGVVAGYYIYRTGDSGAHIAWGGF